MYLILYNNVRLKKLLLLAVSYLIKPNSVLLPLLLFPPPLLSLSACRCRHCLPAVARRCTSLAVRGRHCSLVVAPAVVVVVLLSS